MQLSVDTGQASVVHQHLRLEATWRETVRVVRQEEVRHGSLPIVLDGILNQLPDVDDDLKKIADNIKNETENNFQVEKYNKTCHTENTKKKNYRDGPSSKFNRCQNFLKVFSISSCVRDGFKN